MDLALWIVTGALAAAYFFGGAAKLVLPKQKIAAAGPSAAWTEDWSAGGIKAIGAAEVLGALGLVLPAVLDIAPVLVPAAGIGLVIVMAGAVVVRARRGEVKLVVVDLVYLVLLAFVVWGRSVVEPFTG
ncbi:DoxX family protein [Saccharothrix sp. S26]|uniref:DoxX family protein n=1 Tax=Saccharothrix sp. S26 TaxID=2907215 RepID=UPI001F255858|nr:DoxX family protein [Saccharothrix sp. S26]MCE6994643.1 DoxX family protein [Saccharothrix sp. S26]